MIHPHKGLYLVEIIKKEKAGSVYLPDQNNQQPMMGKVIEVGDPYVAEGGVMEYPTYKVGDIIIFKKHRQHEIEDYSTTTMAFVEFSALLGKDDNAND